MKISEPTRVSWRVWMAAGCFGLFVVPLYAMIDTALRYDPSGVNGAGPTLNNFSKAIALTNLPQATTNTLILVALNVIGALLVNPAVAYGIGRLTFPGSRKVLLVGLSTMMLPFQVVMIPLYFVFDKAGLVGTFWPLVLPPLFGNAFFIFLSIQFIRGIPTELFDAARVDGASNLQVFRLVVLPVIKPLLVLIGTLQFTATWVDFLGPLLYLRDPQYFTLAVSLYNFFGQNGIDWGPLLAACTLFTAPAVIVFLFGQRYFFASGLTSGIK